MFHIFFDLFTDWFINLFSVTMLSWSGLSANRVSWEHWAWGRNIPWFDGNHRTHSQSQLGQFNMTNLPTRKLIWTQGKHVKLCTPEDQTGIPGPVKWKQYHCGHVLPLICPVVTKIHQQSLYYFQNRFSTALYLKAAICWLRTHGKANWCLALFRFSSACSEGSH